MLMCWNVQTRNSTESRPLYRINGRKQDQIFVAHRALIKSFWETQFSLNCPTACNSINEKRYDTMGGATIGGGGYMYPPPKKCGGYRGVQGQLLDTDTDTDTCEMNTFAHQNSKTMAQKVIKPRESLKFSIVHFNHPQQLMFHVVEISRIRCCISSSSACHV